MALCGAFPAAQMKPLAALLIGLLFHFDWRVPALALPALPWVGFALLWVGFALALPALPWVGFALPWVGFALALWALLWLGWALAWVGFALPWVGCWVLGVFGVGCLGCWVFGVLGAWGGVGCRSGCPLWLGEASEGRAREGAPRGEGERRPEAFRALPSEGRAREGARRGEGERRPEGVRASPEFLRTRGLECWGLGVAFGFVGRSAWLCLLWLAGE